MLLRIFMIALGSLFILEVIYLAFVSHYNIGWFITICLGIFLIVYGIFFTSINNLMSHGLLLWLRYFVYGCLIFFCGVVAFLAIYGHNDNVTYNEDAVIVLGAGLRGAQVSDALARRLEAAYDYWQENPDAVIVTTGGQGPKELRSEGEAEAEYLIALGVPEEKIVVEDRSTSTRENFLFARELLAEEFTEPYKVAYVTNAFHIYRAGKIAAETDLAAAHYHGGLAWYMAPVSYAREFAAVVSYWLTHIL